MRRDLICDSRHAAAADPRPRRPSRDDDAGSLARASPVRPPADLERCSGERVIRSPDPAGPHRCSALSPEGPARRAADRSPARPGVRPRPAEQDLLPLPRRRARPWPSYAWSRAPAGRPRGLDPLLADPARRPAGAAAGAARDRARAAGAGDRPGADRGQPGAGGGAWAGGWCSWSATPATMRATASRSAPANIVMPGESPARLQFRTLAGAALPAEGGVLLRHGVEPGEQRLRAARACPCSRPCRAPSRGSGRPWRGRRPGSAATSPSRPHQGADGEDDGPALRQAAQGLPLDPQPELLAGVLGREVGQGLARLRVE